MHECTALSLTPSISSNEPFLIKGAVEGEKEVFKERMKTNRRRGDEISMFTL